MSGEHLLLIEQPPGEQRQVDCIEIYLPKSLEFLSELYEFLREKVTNRLGQIVLDGFSIYEVDGVFYGERFWEQRTLVIRLMRLRSTERPPRLLAALVMQLGSEIATRVARDEEQIWICQYPQQLTVFRGLKRILHP